MPGRVNQWLSNWRTLFNCMLPACRLPITYSPSGCMIWYDKGVSVAWIDTYPSRFFTLHIHLFGFNNAGNYNEYHICNGIWSKKTDYCCLLLTQHRYYFWNSVAFTYSSIDRTVKQNIYYLCASFFFSNSISPRLMSCHCVKPTNPDVTSCLTHRSLGDVQSISRV